MRRIAVLAVALACALGCASAVRWQKSGASDAERQRDETECVSRASREGTIPTAQTVGTATGTPAESQRARIAQFDPALVEECMKARGYERVPPSRPPG
jgi:hypothetical protein